MPSFKYSASSRDVFEKQCAVTLAYRNIRRPTRRVRSCRERRRPREEALPWDAQKGRPPCDARLKPASPLARRRCVGVAVAAAAATAAGAHGSCRLLIPPPLRSVRVPRAALAIHASLRHHGRPCRGAPPCRRTCGPSAVRCSCRLLDGRARRRWPPRLDHRQLFGGRASRPHPLSNLRLGQVGA
jgi:hypothetical protein